MSQNRDLQSSAYVSSLFTCVAGLFAGIFIANIVGQNSATPQLIAQYASVLTSFALLIVTYIYVRETRQTRKQEFEPYIVFELYESGSAGSPDRSSITNIGNGPAMDIDLDISLKNSNGTQLTESVQLAHLRPNSSIYLEKREFRALARYDQDVYSTYDEVIVTGTCDGISSKNIDIEYVTSLEDLERISRKSGRVPISIGEE